MFKNYLLVALRNMRKNKSYIFINTIGLGIAIACCITSYILVAFNLEFDDFHRSSKVENVFRVHTDLILNQGERREAIGAPSPIAPIAADKFSGIISYLRYAGNAAGNASVSYEDKNGNRKTFSEFVMFADSTFFKFFDIPLVSGSHSAFEDISTVFLNEETASKYFGDEDPVGKVMSFGFSRGIRRNFKVGGVVKDMPVNNSLYFPVLLRFEHFLEMRALDSDPYGDWNVPVTFFKLDDASKASTINPLFNEFLDQRNEAFKEQEVTGYRLVPFKSKVNPKNITWTYINIPMEIEPLVIFVVLGLMILLIACFNLTNTSIAMAANRLKEIGVRKAAGAHRNQIIFQFLMETVIVVFLSLGVGYLVSGLIVPEFTAMWGLPYGLEDLDGINMLIALLILVFLTSILIGLYPAIFGTRFNTVDLLKNNVKVSGTNWFTKGLVSLQFAISIVVLIGGVLFIQNTDYQEHIDFGYDKENLLAISLQDPKDYSRMRELAKSIPDIDFIGATEHQVGYSSYPNPISFEGEEYEVKHLEFGENYFETMQFNFIHGRPIDYKNKNDYKEAAVVSKAFLKSLNIQDNPIGKVIVIRGDRKTIVGVVDDFVDNIYVSNEPEPYIFYATVPERWRQIVVRADENVLAKVNDQLEAIWTKEFPDKPYESQFHEDILLGGMRRTNRNLNKIFMFLTILGGILSASGIFSLATLNVARRTKEIGIRKALGASIQNVMYLLSRQFVYILVAAGLIGAIAGYFGTSFLMDMIYARHIPITLTPIIVSALVIILLGLSTTSFTIFRAANSNPVDTLRDE